MWYTQTVQNQYTKINLLWFSVCWVFCHFLSLQQFSSLYFTNKHINSECKIEDLWKHITGTTKLIWKEMNKWKNTSMKMHNYTSSAGRAGILIFALVKYAIFSLKLEKKTRDFFHHLWQDSNVICCRVGNIEHWFFKTHVWKIHRKFIYNKCGILTQLPFYAYLCKKQFQTERLKIPVFH